MAFLVVLIVAQLKAYGFGILAAAVIGLAGWWHFSTVHKAEQLVEAKYTRLIAEQNAQAAAAYAQARAEEQRVTTLEHQLAATVAATDAAAATQKADYEKTIAASRVAADSLRDQLNTIARAYTRQRDAAIADPAAARELQAARNTVKLLADLLGESDERAAVYATAADQSRAAGLNCERAYDAARASVQEATHAKTP